jgi:hypothetical protein
MRKIAQFGSCLIMDLNLLVLNGRKLSDVGIEIKFSPLRHPESNLTEKLMRELGKYFCI